MTYLIDGTNAVRRLFQSSRRTSLAEEHAHMESFLEWAGWMTARHRKKNVHFRVVFDGPPRAFETPKTDGVSLYFGEEGGADRVLLDQARYLCHRGESIILVTADQALAREARSEGAESVRPEEFVRKFGSEPFL